MSNANDTGNYIGVSGIARKIGKIYLGVAGVARKVKKGYIGDADGRARLFFEYAAITVPDAPTNIQATAGNAQATITFSSPANNGGSPITGYIVTVNPGNRTVSGSASPITVTGLTNGVAHTFTVRATNAAGNGPQSAATATPMTVPGAPTNVQATAGNGLATVTFVAPASNGGSPITGYIVTVNPGSRTVSGNASPITITGLTNGVAHTFTVRATNAAGNGPQSAAATATPTVPPGNTNLTTTGSARFFTVPAGVTSLTVLVVGGGGGGSGGHHTFTLAPVTPGQQIPYAIGTGGGGGNNPNSTPGMSGGTTWFSSNAVGSRATGGTGGTAGPLGFMRGNGGTPNGVAGTVGGLSSGAGGVPPASLNIPSNRGNGGNGTNSNNGGNGQPGFIRVSWGQ